MSEGDHRERIDVSFDPDIEDVLASGRRVSRGFNVLAVLALLTFPAVVYWLTRELVFAAVALGVVYLLVGVRAFEVRGESRMLTEKTPAIVRRDFTRLVNPTTTLVVYNADAVYAPGEDDETLVGTCEVSGLVSSQEVPIRIREPAPDTVELEVGDHLAVTVVIGTDYAQTTIDTTVRRSTVNLVALVKPLFLRRTEHRILECYDYRVVESNTAIGFTP